MSDSDESFDSNTSAVFATVEDDIALNQSYYASTVKKAKRIIMVDSGTAVMLLEGEANLLYALDIVSGTTWRVAGKTRHNSDSDSDSDMNSESESDSDSDADFHDRKTRGISFMDVQDIAWDEENNRILILDAGGERLLQLAVVDGKPIVKHVAWIHSREELLHGMTFVAPGVLMIHHYHGVSVAKVEGNNLLLVNQPEDNFYGNDRDMAKVVAMPDGGVYHIDLRDGSFRYCEGPDEAGVWNFRILGGQQGAFSDHSDGLIENAEFVQLDSACPVFVDGQWMLLVSDCWRLRLIHRVRDDRFEVKSIRWNVFGQYPDVTVDRSYMTRALRKYASARISAMTMTEDGSVLACIFDEENSNPHTHGVVKIDGFDATSLDGMYAGSTETVEEAEASHNAQKRVRRKRRMSESPEKGIKSKTRMELKSKLVF